MIVVLKQDYPNLGRVNDIVNVKRGFAANYLIPQGVVVKATKLIIDQLIEKNEAQKALQEKLSKEAESLSSELNNISIELTKKSSSKGKLFGSVSAADIVAGIKDQKGKEVAEAMIRLEEIIKAVGEYPVNLEFSDEFKAVITVKVLAE